MSVPSFGATPRFVGICSGLGVAVLVFGVVMLADHAWYYRYTSETVLLLRSPSVLTEGEFAQDSTGRWTFSPRLAEHVSARLTESERQAFMVGEAKWGRTSATSVSDALTQACELSVDTSLTPVELTVKTSSSDRLLITHLGTTLWHEMLQLRARLEIDKSMREVETLVLEVKKLGDAAPPELIAKLRSANMGGGLSTVTFSQKNGYPIVSPKRQLLGFRFRQSAFVAVSIAILAGLITGIVAGVSRRFFVKPESAA